MSATLRTRIIKIGNSQGIRLPKPLLEQSGIQAEVEVEVQGDRLIIRAAPQSRVGWEESFASMAEQQDDTLLDAESSTPATEWDQTEWEW